MMTLAEIRDEVDDLCWEVGNQILIGETDWTYISKARRILLDTPDLQQKFINELYEVLHRATDFDHGITPYHLVDSDANEQCEALLRVFGRWRE